MAWLTRETAPPPHDLALDWLGKKSPTRAETKQVEAVVEGWLLGRESWALWDYVGRATRRAVDHDVLQTWRRSLVARYPAIARFHQSLRDFFWGPAGADSYRRFDMIAHRAYVNRQTQKLLDALSLLIAFAIEGEVVARFQDWLLVQGPKPKSIPAVERIERKLLAAFPSARFNIHVEELT